jgi:hypothetical protein
MMTNIVAMVIGAILTVESSGGKDLRDGDGGRAVGPFQIWTCTVDEANRVERLYARRYGRKPRVWTHADRRCHAASEAICELLTVWHYRRGITDPIELACRWRNPYSKTQPAYRNKIRKAMKL